MNCTSRRCLLELDGMVQLLEEERRQHAGEVKQIEESLEVFARAKREEIGNMQSVIERMAGKAEKYKGRCCGLNEKVKQLTDTIKTINAWIASLEDSLRICKDDLHR
jgi:chromosome segregation ATPase